MGKNISLTSKVLLCIAACLFIVSIFLPLWSIELSAPQYPEGLKLFIGARGLSGDVDSVNELNHYIGMERLYSSNFIEFTILPYILGFFALLTLVCIFVKKRKFTLWSFIVYAIFGIVSLIDFWRWNYNYGHNLSDDAAIKVPGMSYQPPLIGYKQLLNFGAYSMPSIGGILLVVAALLFAVVIIKEYDIWNIIFKKKAV